MDANMFFYLLHTDEFLPQEDSGDIHDNIFKHFKITQECLNYDPIKDIFWLSALK